MKNTRSAAPRPFPPDSTPASAGASARAGGPQGDDAPRMHVRQCARSHGYFGKVRAGLLGRGPLMEGRSIKHTCPTRQMRQRQATLERHKGRARRLFREAQREHACMDAYDRKLRLTSAGKGRHSLSGIPAWYLERQHLLNTGLTPAAQEVAA